MKRISAKRIKSAFGDGERRRVSVSRRLVTISGEYDTDHGPEYYHLTEPRAKVATQLRTERNAR